MRTLDWRFCLLIALGLATSGASGCGSASQESPSGGAAATASSEDRQGLPTASIGTPKSKAKSADDEEEEDEADDPADAEAAKVELKEGSPEWCIREATRLRLEAPPKTDDVEKLKAHRKERNEKIVEYCQKAIAQVHADKEKERMFTAAVHHMLEARLQLATAGDRDSVDALYEDAAALYKRDPQSAAAMEAAYTLVTLSYNSAKSGSGTNKQWVGEFTRQASNFAKNFPKEEPRSLPLLFTAARSCELIGMTKEAIEAYTLIQQTFPQSQYAQRVAAIQRRLKLVGNPPQLSGPTLSGDQVVLDDLLGQPILVVFWSTEAKSFVSALPTLLEITRSHRKEGLKVVGVTLDTDATAVNQFLVEHKVPWPQIFFAEEEKQGWNNPIASYYGIMEIPALWLIDQSGNVVSTTATVENLDVELSQLLGDTPKAAKGTAEGVTNALSETPAPAKKKAPRKSPAKPVEEE